MIKRFGYRIDLENYEALEANGIEFRSMMRAYGNKFPAWNVDADPAPGVSVIEDQGAIGSCVGNSISSVVEACYFLATGRTVQLSRAAAYYKTQKIDGIRGDNGATISGAQKLATTVGLCLESEWPYVPRYNPSEPAGCNFDYRVAATKPIKSLDDFDAWIKLGLPVHVGTSWNSSCDGTIVDNYNPDMRNSGGHAIMFWNMVNGNYRMLNSWGGNWNKDGQNEWTPRAIEIMLRHKWAVAIGYAPTAMMFPNLEPINTAG